MTPSGAQSVLLPRNFGLLFIGHATTQLGNALMPAAPAVVAVARKLIPFRSQLYVGTRDGRRGTHIQCAPTVARPLTSERDHAHATLRPADR